jgi:transcriptional regulator with GAF, ATPase, and Fis domain
MMGSEMGLEETLGRISLRTASTLDLGEVLAEITRGLVDHLQAAMARVWLIRKRDPGVLQLTASAGLSERLDGTRSRVPVGSLKIGEIAATRVPVCSTDLSSDPRFVDKAWIAQEKLVAFAGYPLVFHDELLGVLAMFTRRPISDAEFQRLGVFAAQASVAIQNAYLFAEVNDLTRRLEAENAYLKEELQGSGAAGIVGESPSLARAMTELERVAKATSTVLLLGETGTGKELFARALHEMSPRRGRTLVKVNCAALSPSLIESELFGHEKGAFTGALSRKVGRFELATGGTLFLDEVGELSPDAQAKLLRALQEHEIERVGGTQPIPVDVRVVAATNRDLAADVRAGRFRADLYFRLNVFPIAIPPLRSRKDDLPALVETIARKLGARLGTAPKAVDEDALLYLKAYDWPGNVRELENVLERATILADGPTIGVADLPPFQVASEAEASGDAGATPLKQRVEAFERGLIADALQRADNNQSEAARLLRVSRATLQYKMKTYGL